MVKLELNDSEQEILSETLQNFLGNLSYEIADTDLKSFRDELKERRSVLTGILARISAPPGD